MKLKKVVAILIFFIVSLFAEGEIKLEKITSFGGTLNNMIIVNDKVFVSTTDGLKIFDASDKKNIKLLSYLNNLGECSKMDIVNNRIYLTNKTKGLIIVNISDLTNPYIEGKTYFLQENAVNDKAEANAVKVKDNYAYITVGKKGLAVVDVSSPSSPKMLNYFQIDGYTVGIDIKDSYAYVISTIEGLYIIDISNPNKPVLASNLVLDGQCNDIKVDGNYAYVANKDGLQIVDITDPNKPKLITTYDTNGYCLALDKKDDNVYVANGTDVKIIDITNKNSPTLINKVSKTDFHCYDVKVSGDFMYVLNNNKPCVSDISDPYDVKCVSSFDTASLIKKIEIVDGKAYIANDYNGIQIADVSNMKSIKLLGEYFKEGVANDIEIKDSTLFVANNHKGLQILDVSDPSNIKLLSSLSVKGVAKGIFLKDCCAFIARDNTGLAIVDVENLSSPYIKGTFDTDGNAYDVAVEGNYAFIADGYNGLVIVNVSDRANPVKVSEIKLKDFAYGLEVKGSFVYIADGDGGLQIVDVSDINSPKIIGNIDTDGQARDVTLWENFAFISDNDKGIKVVDISNPNNLKIVEEVNVNNISLSTYIDGNKLFLANFSNGILIFQIIKSPQAVSRFDSKDIKSDRVTLEWELPQADELSPIDNIKIFREGSLIKTLEGSAKSFTDTGLQEDTTYNYEIKLSNKAGDSPSKKLAVKTLKAIPLPPTSLSVKSIWEDSVELLWKDNSNNEDGFKIFRDSNLIFTTKANVESFKDTGLESGTSYVYMVKAFNESGDSTGDVITVKTLQSAPKAPSDFQAKEIKNNLVTLIWKDNSDNEDGFRIYRDGEVIGYLSKDMTSFTDRTVEPAKEYVYAIEAVNKAGVSEKATLKIKTVDTVPLPPTSLEAIVIDDDTIRLEWDDNSYNEKGFEIYKNGKLIYTTNININYYVDNDVTVDTLYTYLVKAVNDAGSSAADKISVKISKTVPIPVTDLSATAVSDKEVLLKWKDNANNEQGFEIYRDGILIDKIGENASSYKDKGLSPNTVYKYSVKAFNEKGSSVENSVEVKTFSNVDEVPSPVVDFIAEALSPKVVKLEWKDSNGNEYGYEIYRNDILIAHLDYQNTSFIDSGLKPDTLYEYKIVAFNAKGKSEPVKTEIKTYKYAEEEPNAPLDFKAIANGEREVWLEWKDNSDNEDGFKIYRDGKLIYITHPDSTFYLDTGLSPATLYRYTIQAVNYVGESNTTSAEVKTLYRENVLYPPTNLNAKVQDSKFIILTWSDNSDNEDGFKIYRDGKLIFTTKRDVNKYVDSGLEENRFYTYTVKATNSYGDSIGNSIKVEIKTTIVQSVPQPPTDFNAIAVSEEAVSLKWVDNSDNEDGFEIYRDGVLIYKTKKDVTYYTDTGLKPDTLYKYSIKAFNAKGTSIENTTEVKTFAIDEDVPNPPANFVAKAISSRVVKLEWNDMSDNERAYKIYRDGKLITVVDYKTTSYMDTGLSPDTEYEYTLYAVNSKGDSKPVTAKVKTKSKPASKPKAPSEFKAIANGDRIVELRWRDNSDNEEGFKIYRDGKFIYQTVPNQRVFIDYNLKPKTTYKYEIRATNEIGDSEGVSAEVTTLDKDSILIPPTNLFGEVKDKKYIVLTWSDNSDNEDGFKIYRNDELIYTTKKDVTSFTDKNVEENKVYMYVVKATNSYGDSIGDSIKIQISNLNSYLPTSPSEFKAEKEGVLNVKLSWINDDGSEKKYNIFRNGELIYTADSNETSYIDMGVEPDIEYVYSIVAFNENGETKPLEATIKLTLNQVQTFVYNLYKKVLERKPDDEGLLYWEEELKSRNKTALFVVEQFFKSPEFLSKEIDSEKYVKILYKTFFNREPEYGGLAYWKMMIDENDYPKDMLLYKFAFSTEFKNICAKFGITNYNDEEKAKVFVERLYQMVLKRASDRESLEYWVSEIMENKRDPKEIVKFFFNSDEFKNKNISNKEFVMISYRALLDREPDREGMEYWIGQLENGLDKEKFLDIFLDSKEFETLIKKGFVNEL